MNQHEYALSIRIGRLNRLARQSAIGDSDATWLERHAVAQGLVIHPYSRLISQLQDLFGLELVAARLTS